MEALWIVATTNTNEELESIRIRHPLWRSEITYQRWIAIESLFNYDPKVEVDSLIMDVNNEWLIPHRSKLYYGINNGFSILFLSTRHPQVKGGFLYVHSLGLSP